MYEILKDKNMRYQYCQKDFITFCIYYFPEYFTYNLSDKHKQYMNSLRGDNNVFICGFREFGKTVIAKLYIIWCICYKKYRNIMIYGYEQDKSKDILFDMITILQSNVNIINDFGNIYNSDRTRRKSEKKTILEFITNNQIRVKAMSIGKSPRGDVFGSSDGQYRPDLILLDDIDVTKSVQNEKIIEYNYNRLRSEVFGGLAQDKHKIVFLGNVINEDGVVPRIYNQYPKRDRYRIPIIDDDNNIIRPQRYKQEDIQRLQDQQGDIGFAQNFLLKPYTGQGIVKRGWIRYTNLKQYDKGYDKIIIGVDPASSTKEISDGFAIVVCGHHKYGKDIICAYNLKGEDKEKDNAISVIVGLYKQYKANIVNFESTNAYIYMANDIKKKGIAVKAINPHRDKVTRLLQYESELKNGNIQFVNDGEGIGELINQLLLFPNAKNDDLVDAMVYSLYNTIYSISNNSGGDIYKINNTQNYVKRKKELAKSGREDLLDGNDGTDEGRYD